MVDAVAGLQEPANVWRRFVCIVYEGVILFGVTFFFSYAFSALTQFKAAPGPLRDAHQYYMVLVYGAYFGWFWTNGRRTLPMKTTQVRLVTSLGTALSWQRALGRYLIAGLLYGAVFALLKVAAIAAVLFLVPLAWCLFDKQSRALYDLLAGTKLVFDPRAMP
jgi:uncharacterized RDD family membrane protein YckC